MNQLDNNIENFYSKECSSTTMTNIFLLKNRVHYLQIDKTKCDRQYIELKHAIRLVNPKVDGNKREINHIEENELTDDFDSALSELSEKQYHRYELNFENKSLYFLPSDLEKILKDVLYGNKTKKIPRLLEQYIPETLKREKVLEFIEENSEVISNQEIPKYSISFFKVFKKPLSELSKGDSIEKFKQLKNELNTKLIDGIEYFFIGNIPENAGLLEINENSHFPDPLTYHYNFWKLENFLTQKLSENFELQSF